MAKRREDEFIAAFGKRLIELRKSKNLTQEEFAHRCGLEFSDIGRIERGKLDTGLTKIYILSKGLKVHPKELLNFDI